MFPSNHFPKCSYSFLICLFYRVFLHFSVLSIATQGDPLSSCEGDLAICFQVNAEAANREVLDQSDTDIDIFRFWRYGTWHLRESLLSIPGQNILM